MDLMQRLVKSQAAVAVFCLTGLLSSCTERSIAECAPFKDWGVETLGVQIPKPLPIDLSKIESATLAKHYTSDIAMLASVLNGNFDDAQAYWDAAAAIPDQTERLQAFSKGLYKLNDRGLYSLHAAQAWEAAHPESKAAKLFLATAYSHAASEGRGGEYISKTSKEQLDLLSVRWAKAESLFLGLLKEDDIYSWAAKLGMLSNLFYTGRSAEGWSTYEYLIGKAPQNGWLYFDAAEYAKPKWAGKQSQERTQFLLQLADTNKLNELDRKVLEQETSAIVDDVENNPNPEAWRPYWNERVEKAPHTFNLIGLLHHEGNVRNWPKVVEISQKIIDKAPHNVTAWQWRGRALKEIGTPAEAFTATLTSTILGFDWSMDRIIRAHLNGGLGRKPGDQETLYAYCKMGVALGSAASANCMGSTYTDGILGIPRDNKKAVEWHMLAARGGNANSQHDLSVLLPQVVPGPEAQDAAQFWLRRSAAQEHEYAKKKLASQGKNSTISFGCEAESNLFSNFISRIFAIFKIAA
jgi:hypothetical protein